MKYLFFDIECADGAEESANTDTYLLMKTSMLLKR